MGLLDVLRRLFGGSSTPTRDTSGLDADSGRSIEVAEEIDTSGGPLKPNHLRRSLRDPRLLPKAQPKVDPKRFWKRPERKRVMSADEANRLFSRALRTRDRRLRDLAIDEEQLQRYGLPVWRGEEDVARALDLSVSQLRHYSIHRDRETTPHYVTFAVPKRRGGARLIHAPKRRLKAIQRQLLAQLVCRLPVSDSAHGFREQRSVGSNAQPHVGKQVVVKFDLRDCFPTIHFGRVRGLLIAYGYSYPVATALSVLMTEAPRQPVLAEGKTYHVPVGPRVCVQGAPTSPGLCNAVLVRLDRRLAGLASRLGADYTRYADDLTISGNRNIVGTLLKAVPSIVVDEGFEVHRNPEQARPLQRALAETA